MSRITYGERERETRSRDSADQDIAVKGVAMTDALPIMSFPTVIRRHGVVYRRCTARRCSASILVRWITIYAVDVYSFFFTFHWLFLEAIWNAWAMAVWRSVDNFSVVAMRSFGWFYLHEWRTMMSPIDTFSRGTSNSVTPKIRCNRAILLSSSSNKNHQHNNKIHSSIDGRTTIRKLDVYFPLDVYEWLSIAVYDSDCV